MKLFEKKSQITTYNNPSRRRTPILAIIGLLAVLATVPLLTSAVAAASFDFSLASSNGITVVQGGEGSTTITVTLTSGSAQQVVLSCSGLPAGATCSPNPQTGFPTFSSMLTINAAFSTPVGTGTFNVIGTSESGSLVHSIPVTIDVRPAGSVGGTSLPTTTSSSLLPMTAIGVTIIAIIGAAVYGVRSRARTGAPRPRLDPL